MTYPLIFSNGGFGWILNLKSTNDKNNRTTLQFDSYRLSDKTDLNPFLNLGRLTQQFIVDAWVKVE